MAQICKMEKGDYFEELRNPVMTIAKRIDLLIFKGYIITDNYKLLQDNFNFQQYINGRATNMVNTIKHKGIVANIEKLNEYMQRSSGSSKYIKKLMRIADSRVLSMSKTELIRKIRESPRWYGKLSEKNGVFLLKTYKQVEAFIDLLDERFTRSEITGEEYDTSVKSVAKPI